MLGKRDPLNEIEHKLLFKNVIFSKFSNNLIASILQKIRNTEMHL